MGDMEPLTNFLRAQGRRVPTRTGERLRHTQSCATER